MGRIVKRSQVRTPLERLGAAAEKARADRIAAALEASRIRTEAQREVIDLALGIAERIVGRAVETDPALLDRIYREALAALPAKPPVRLHVHPADRASGQADRIASRHAVEVVEDEAVGRGGCRVSAGPLEVDAALLTALRAFGGALRGERDG